MTLDKLFGEPLTCDIPSHQIQDWIALLAPLLPLLPALEIPPDQLRIINGYLLPEGHVVVADVVRTLSEQGALFPDVPQRPDELAEDQACATAWLILREAARIVADRADRCYRLKQAQAVFDAMQAVRQVRNDQGKPYSGEAEAARQLAMEPAELTLAGYQDDKQGD